MAVPESTTEEYEEKLEDFVQRLRELWTQWRWRDCCCVWCCADCKELDCHCKDCYCEECLTHEGMSDMKRVNSLQQKVLCIEVCDRLKGMESDAFERLVNRLLSQMGYGEVKRETGRSGDRGIDGILNQDTLGLEKIYVQAKRYNTATVGEPEIRNFSGSLDGQGATKGVFITTATFAQRAWQTAENISMGNKSIILIDGRQLAQLMIRHGVGVVTEITYEIKTLDANYFAEA